MSPATMTDVREAGALVTRLERSLTAAVRDRDTAVRAAVVGGATMTAVAREAGISRERVRQIMAAS